MEHPWFKNFKWQSLISQKMKAPFLPDFFEENFDKEHVEHESSHTPSYNEDIKKNKLLLRRDSV